MATNYIQEGKSMYLVTESGAKSGNPFVVGDYLPCVLLTDADADDSHKAAVATEGVFSLSVDGVTPGAVSAGDMLYWTAKDAVLSKDSTGKPFGIALEATEHASAAIKVMLTPKATVPASVGADELESNAVQEEKILNGAVTENKIGAAAVAYSKLKADVTRLLPIHQLSGSHGAKMEPTTSGFYLLITDSGEGAFTMGDPVFEGQQVAIKLEKKQTDDLVITFDSPVNDNDDDIITLDTEGESVILVAANVSATTDEALEWRVIADAGAPAFSATT